MVVAKPLLIPMKNVGEVLLEMSPTVFEQPADRYAEVS
jgi:hypothetical protein